MGQIGLIEFRTAQVCSVEARVGKVTTRQVSPVGARTSHQRLHESYSGQLGAREIDLAHLTLEQASAAQIGVSERATAEHAVAEIGVAQHSPAQVRRLEAGA